MPDQFAGYFHCGRLVNNRPQSLPGWRITTGDAEVAKEVARLMGGLPEEWDSSCGDYLEVLTSAARTCVIIEGPSALTTEMRLWKRSQLVHHCDGTSLLSPEELQGYPCGCPPTMAERKAAAKAFRGPQPITSLTFRLADAPSLGLFLLRSMSWKLAEDACGALETLGRASGPALAELCLDLVELTTSGGRTVAYRKPGVVVHQLDSESESR
ncbi:hypothetical protein ACFY1P_19400 [Streptomyces sp. NPDC001407]|uniref:recombination directionality factor n=1 Tax=unclassified Streptomyces TaxID=2593676 RepID=UPI0036B9F1E5